MSTSFADKRRRQQQEALVAAQKVRRVKKIIKDRLRSGEIDPITLVAGLDDKYSPAFYEMRCGPVLKAIPRVGERTLYELLQESGMTWEDRLMYKTKPEIDLLVENLRAVILYK